MAIRESASKLCFDVKKPIFKAILILIFGLIILLIDKRYYIYAYYRAVNGDSFSGVNAKLASGFYFYEKDKSGNSYTVFHRDVEGVVLFVFSDKKPDFVKYIHEGLVVARPGFGDCEIYQGKGKVNSIYIDFSRDNVINAVLNVNDTSQETLHTFCGMLAK